MEIQKGMININILATQYTLSRKSLEIYMAGCKGNVQFGHCPNCHNPESWNFNQGKYYKEEVNKILNKIQDFNEMIDRIDIFGGEPNDQNHSELEDFLKILKNTGKELWLWTSWELKDCPQFEKELCDYIKTGFYNERLSCDNNIQYKIKLATSNQKINKKGIDY